MILQKDGIYSLVKDGTQYYKVKRKRTIIARFLQLSDAEKHFNKCVTDAKNNDCN
jgi:hypothetical protein